jgi:hypothetical protein
MIVAILNFASHLLNSAPATTFNAELAEPAETRGVRL